MNRLGHSTEPDRVQVFGKRSQTQGVPLGMQYQGPGLGSTVPVGPGPPGACPAPSRPRAGGSACRLQLPPGSAPPTTRPGIPQESLALARLEAPRLRCRESGGPGSSTSEIGERPGGGGAGAGPGTPGGTSAQRGHGERQAGSREASCPRCGRVTIPAGPGDAAQPRDRRTGRMRGRGRGHSAVLPVVFSAPASGCPGARDACRTQPSERPFPALGSCRSRRFPG